MVMMNEVKEVNVDAHYFKCVHCGDIVVVGDYYCMEAERLCKQHACQNCAEGKVQTLWNS